jgi:hypothetical protein
MTTDNFCFYLQNRPIQTSQTGGQWYTDTFPCIRPRAMNVQASIDRVSPTTTIENRLAYQATAQVTNLYRIRVVITTLYFHLNLQMGPIS